MFELRFRKLRLGLGVAHDACACPHRRSFPFEDTAPQRAPEVPVALRVEPADGACVKPARPPFDRAQKLERALARHASRRRRRVRGANELEHTLARYVDECPTRKTLFEYARTGASCDEWLLPTVSPECERPVPEDCSPGVSYDRCSADLRHFESCASSGGERYYHRRDCAGLNQTCTPAELASCSLSATDEDLSVLFEGHLCHAGRYLVFPHRQAGSGSPKGTQWLDCRELGFAGCTRDEGGYRTSRCVVEMP